MECVVGMDGRLRTLKFAQPVTEPGEPDGGSRAAGINRQSVTFASHYPDRSWSSGRLAEVKRLDVVGHPRLAAVALAEDPVAVGHRLFPQVPVFLRAWVQAGSFQLLLESLGRGLDFLLLRGCESGFGTQIHPCRRLLDR